jgi:hypothetical protein
MRKFIYRTLPEDFKKTLYIWDVDKTYLNTNFESLKGLMKILFEFSIDKRSIPGVKNLLLELRKGAGPDIEISPIYFISASPVYLKKVLEGKFLLDGVQHDGIFLKDYFELRSQVGKLRFKNNFAYKLVSLLNHRLDLPPSSKEILFGDDFESDAEVYSMYADILSSKIDEENLMIRLSAQRLHSREIDRILSLFEKVEKKNEEVVRRIFIHLISPSDLNRFRIFGDRLVPTRNYMQTAAVLYEMGAISKNGFQRVANSFNLKYPGDGWTLAKSLKDLKERCFLQEATFEELALR